MLKICTRHGSIYVDKVEDCDILDSEPYFTVCGIEGVKLLNEIVESYGIIPVVRMTYRDYGSEISTGWDHREIVRKYLRDMNPNMIVEVTPNLLSLPD